MDRIEATIESIKEETPHVKSFFLEVSKPFQFKPGQHIMIFKPNGEDKFLPRAYSITSLPNEMPNLGLCIKQYPHGRVSTYMFERKEGDKILISNALGHLTLRNPEKPIVFMATGTGIAPVVSLCKDLIQRGMNHKIHVMFGARNEEDIIYNDLFRQWEKDYENFHFIPCLSNALTTWKGRKGFVQENVDCVPPNWNDNDFYIVGLNVMVKECKKFLLQHGVPENQIFTESE